jgi:extracellular factor (EF) 3-hydroxypalmitic acid methyl ester biosynthesis protein
MEEQVAAVDAWVLSGKKKHPLTARYASKYSLWVRFQDPAVFKDGSEFSELIIQREDATFELGPCRLISEPNIEGYSGRLVLSRDFHDLESLLFHGKQIKLQTSFLNLSSLLDHKASVLQSFKDYAADLSYDLNVYKTLFDTLDTEYRGEPENIRRIVQQAILREEGRAFMGFLDQKLAELERLVAGLSKTEREEHGFYLRKLLWNIILCSPIMTRTNLKPRGYAGDSEMMRMIYSNDYEGDSTFSKLMHKHPVEQPAADAVRNRRAFVAEWVRRYRTGASASGRKRLQILSVACGPAFELWDLLDSPRTCQQLHFTLFDQDSYALLEAARVVDQIEKAMDVKLSVEYLRESVRTMLFTQQLVQRWGQYNLIYSMGLFDYLTPPVAVAVLGRLYQLLLPGGQMVVGNFHPSNKSRVYMDYWLDWVLYYRTEAELLELAPELPGAELSVTADPSGIQLFLHVGRK